uniref:Uncharacterized protein n=1 Tax=Scleropages formosus TaxID=113540 RepID=A0A8C9T2B6_SCLFO
ERMRLLVRAALSLVVLCCLTERAQGAPKGRYAWVRCNPFGNKSNCVTHMGPWIDLPQPSKAGNPGNVEKESLRTYRFHVQWMRCGGVTSQRISREDGSGQDCFHSMFGLFPFSEKMRCDELLMVIFPHTNGHL